MKNKEVNIQKNRKKIIRKREKKIIKGKNKNLHDEILKLNEVKDPIKTLKRLLKFFKYEKRMFVIGIILSVITTILGIIANFILKPLVDEITKGNITGFIENILLYTIIGLITMILSFISSTTLAVMAQKIIAKLRKNLFEHMETLSIEYFDKNQSGDIISVYTNDIELLSTALDQSIVKILIAVLQIVIVMGILFYLNWILALVILFLLVIYTILITIFGKKAEKHSKIKQHRLGNLNAYSEELISNMQTVKIFNYEERNIKRFNEKVIELEDSAIRTHFYGIIPHGISGFLTSALFGIIGIIGGYLQIKGYISLGMIVVYIQFVRNLTQPIETIAGQFSTLMTALASTERIFNIMDTKPEIDVGNIIIKTINNKKYWDNNGKLIEAHGFIEFKNVDFSYNNKDITLKDISLWAKPGQK